MKRRVFESINVLTAVIIIAALCLFFSPQQDRVATAAAPTDIVLEVFSQAQIMLYSQPSTGAPVLRPIGTGNRMTWNGAYQVSEGRNWMFVEISGSAGWISPENDAVYWVDPSNITPGIDRAAIIAPSTNAMSLYQAPGRGNAKIATIQIGTQLKVIDGPVVTDLYTWWPVQVVATGQQGWIVDTTHELQVITPLTVYGFQVCDNFDLKTHGVVGWDGVRSVIPLVKPVNEQVVCLASTKLRNGTVPTVVVLTRDENPNRPYDVLRIFEPSGATWAQTYEANSGDYNRTQRLSLHDFPGGSTMLFWVVRVQGTGGILNVAMLRYRPTGIAPIFLENGLYKGSFSINAGILSLFQALPRADEANCCISTGQRIAYQYDPAQDTFIPISNITFLVPSFAQGRPAQ